MADQVNEAKLSKPIEEEPAVTYMNGVELAPGEVEAFALRFFVSSDPPTLRVVQTIDDAELAAVFYRQHPMAAAMLSALVSKRG